MIKDQKTILFVPRRSRIRPYKIAKALKYTGQYRLVCVCEQNWYDPTLHDGIFDEVIYYRSKNFLEGTKYYPKIRRFFNERFDNLLAIIKKIDPDIVHSFAEPYDHTEMILKNTDYPVVLTDGADLTGISAGIPNLDPVTRQQEQYCFENMSGIIYKGPPYVTEYYRNNGYKIDCEELSWFDHCDEDIFQPEDAPKLSDEDGEPHFVFTGHVSTNPQIKYCYYIDLGKMLAKQKIHLHIYPNPYQYKQRSVYHELAQKEKYFHFHRPLPYLQLTKEIARYDWGFWIHAADTSARTTEDKHKVGIGNKLFSYLEAGLPIMVSDSRPWGVEVVESNGVGFKVNDADWHKFDRLIAQHDTKTFQQQVILKREALSLRNNADKLVAFYDSILSK